MHGPTCIFWANLTSLLLQDRLWGNIGLGYGSDFLSLTGTTSIALHLRAAPAPSSVTLNPDLSAVQGWTSAQFGVTANRDFVMAVSLASKQCGSATFRIDTGNQVRKTPSWPRSWPNFSLL